MGITTTGDNLGDSTDGYVTPNPEVYNAVADEREHEIDPGTLNPKEPPRHDKYAAENGGGEAERVEPYTATGANPSYPEDRPSGIAEPDPDVEPEKNEIVDVTAGQREVVEGQDGDGAASPERITVEPPDPDTVEALAAGEVPESAVTETEVVEGVEVDTAIEPPPGNASGEEWRAYAMSQGMSSEEADSMGRDELRDRYAGG